MKCLPSGYEEGKCAHLSRRGPVLTRTVELDELADVRRLRSGTGLVQSFLDEDSKAPSVYRQL